MKVKGNLNYLKGQQGAGECGTLGIRISSEFDGNMNEALLPINLIPS